MDKNFRIRLSICFLIIALFGASVIIRSAMLTLVPSKRLDNLLSKQFREIPKPTPRRGFILDRNREPLAVSVDVRSLYAHPDKVTNKGHLALKLAKIFKIKKRVIKKKLDQKKSFVWIKRKTSKEEEQKIRALLNKNRSLHLALGFIKESQRFYPNQQLAAHVLGFTGTDSHGLEGLEYTYEKELSEKNGNSLMLTLDKNLQHVVEKELFNGIKIAEAKSGSAIIMDASTGSIRAMASFPTYNPNKFLQSKRGTRRNLAISEVFEPGSTIKTLLVTAALEEKIITPESKFFCEHGKMKIGNHWIKESSKKHKWGWLKVKEILKFSSNIGITKIGFHLGKEKLSHWIKAQGLSKRTGISLSGEEAGSLRPFEKWSEIGHSNISFGQGFSVTALQLIQSYAIIANGGFLIRPRIVQHLETAEGKILKRTPIKISRVLSSSTVKEVQKMLKSVTEEGGTGQNAAMDNFEIAGKTGTAQIAKPGIGYIDGKYIASFIGFPLNLETKLIALVVIREPKSTHIWGAETAAPVFKKIMEAALNFRRRNKTYKNN